MELKNLLQYITTNKIIGSTKVDVKSVESDSRNVAEGSLFVAQRGATVDGHSFIDKAIDAGAKVVVCEELPADINPTTTFIEVEDSNVAIGELAAAFYGHPSQQMKVIGVTGTNGKTSIATLLYKLFKNLGYKVGLISTISHRIDEKEEVAQRTTPFSLKIQQLMAEMVETGCEYCFMEVSSHATHQKRVQGIEFKGAIFTNITLDHLDYHKTFAEYIKAKKLFFDNLSKDAFALINIDDKNGNVMVQNTKAKVSTFSVGKMADFRGKVLENHFDGMLLNFDDTDLWTRFVGQFNASNLLAVYATAIILNQDREEVLQQISNLEPVEGRFEIVRSAEGKFGVVDYAHTPDALKNVLQAINDTRQSNQEVITVVGCGGDRDKSKRPIMAQEALAQSDKVILTSDNPRTEDPAQIVKDMEAGVKKSDQKRVLSIVNRREAIKTATVLAQPGDIILIAGKGHETYQEVNGVKHHFDDKEEIMNFFKTDE